MAVISNLTWGQRSVAMFVHWSMCHFKLTQGSIITKHPYLSVPYHWWIAKGKDDQKANDWVKRRVIALKSLQVAAHSFSICSEGERAVFSLQPDLCLQVSASSVWQKTLNRMSSLKDICSGFPLDPLPPNRGRDPNVPHAPMRTPNLTAEEERVSKHTNKFYAFECFIAFVTL